MHLRIIYHNNKFDYVIQKTFQWLLDKGLIKQFFRHSEQRWVTVGVDRMRGDGVHFKYTGRCERASTPS